MMLNGSNRRKIGVYTAIAGLVFACLFAVDAQAGGKKSAITLKDGKASVSGNMTAEADTYTIKLKKGKTYAISMTSAAPKFDTYLRLRDNKSNEIAKDDDGGNALNALLVFQPSATTTYTIVATSFLASGRGAYDLEVSEISVVAFKNGKFSAAGTLAARKTTVYAINAKAGESFVINLMSAKFDTFLVVRDTKQQRIAFNDDGGEGLNSRLVFTPRAGGYYFICAMALGTEGQGEYQFSVERKTE